MPPTADSASQSVPEYALKHAPIVWLHKDDEFFPSHPVEHLQHVNPKTFAGADVNVPADIKNKVKALSQSDVNKGDVFLTLDVRCVSARREVSPSRPPEDRMWILYPSVSLKLSIWNETDRTSSERRQGEPEYT